MIEKIPEKIKIGCFEYKVEITDEPIIVKNNSNYNGVINYNEQVIKLNKRMPENLMIQVFWHEIIHGIANYFEMDLELEQEEKICECMSKGILMILKDNKNQEDFKL